MNKLDLANYSKAELLNYIQAASLDDVSKLGLVWEHQLEAIVNQCVDKLPVLKEIQNRRIISTPPHQHHLIY